MASLFLISPSSLLSLTNHNKFSFTSISTRPNFSFLSLSISTPNFPLLYLTSLRSTNPNKFSSIRLYSTLSDSSPDPDPLSGKSPATFGASEEDPDDESSEEPETSAGGIADEWGEKAEVEPEASFTKLGDADPPVDEDEWGGEGIGSGNGSATTAAAGEETAVEVDKIGDLKRCLVDTVYGTNLGFETSTEVRAEVLELVNQLEAVNPTPAPTEAAALLDGNWVLL